MGTLALITPGQPLENPVTGERFEVVEGRMRFRIGLSTRLAGPGEVIEVAPGVRTSRSSRAPTTRSPTHRC